MQPLALRCRIPDKTPVCMPFPVGPRPPRPKWTLAPPPVYNEDPPSAAEAVDSLILALRNGMAGPYKTKYADTKSADEAIELALVQADAAGVDPEKLRVAREVLKSRAVPDLADRFW